MGRLRIKANAVALALILIVSLPSCAHIGKGWTKKNTAVQAAWSVMQIMDWSQTRTIARNPGEYCELNPLLGKHPSVGEVDTYFAAGLVLNGATAYALPPPYREWFQGISVGLTGTCLMINYKLGIGMGDGF